MCTRVSSGHPHSGDYRWLKTILRATIVDEYKVHGLFSNVEERIVFCRCQCGARYSRTSLRTQLAPSIIHLRIDFLIKEVNYN